MKRGKGGDSAEAIKEVWMQGYREGAIEERERLVRIASSFGAGVALTACGFVRCKERHGETDQRCLLGEAHVRDDGYSTHQSENVTWLTGPAEPRK